MSGPFLRMVGPNFFSGDMVTNYDDYLCKKMGFYGFSPWLDSDTIIKLLRPPGKIWEFWQDKNPNPNTAEHRAEVDNIIKTVMSAPLHVPDA